MDFEEEVLQVGEGWRPIVRAMHEQVLLIDPDIEVQQIKEKFGGLRYYYDSKHKFQSDEANQIETLVAEAEQACDVICEECGKGGRKVSVSGWLKTLCEECERARRQARREMFS